MDRKVEVWGKDVGVSVHQVSKTVWVATGVYLGHHIEVKGRTANSAMSLWADAAKYKGG